jgi:hypothetical protein
MPASDLLIVEDGTGKPDANSYVDLTTFLGFCTMYDYADVLTLEEEQQVAALLKAKDYIETFYYRGIPSVQDQALSFPRVECFPVGAFLPIPSDKVPEKIKRAQMSAAVLSAQDVDLQPTVHPGGFVVKEKVGPIETQYADGVANGMSIPVFTGVDSLLQDYIQTGVGSGGRYSLRTIRA